ncbi:Putative zinc transporter msc2 [Rhodosporidiobolus nylandii]
MSAGGYAEAYDPRRGGRIPMASFEGQLRYGAATSLPLDLLFGVLLSKSLAALALHVAKDWVLDAGGMRASSLSAWTMAVAGVALSQLSVFRFILLTSFASLWARGLPILKTGGRRAVGSSNALFMTGAMVIAAYVVDSFLTAGVARKGYVFLLLHLLAAGQRSEIYSSFTGDERARGKMHANAALIAAGISGVLAFVHSLFSPSCTAAAATPASTAFTPPATSLSVNLLSAAILALTYLVFDPLLTRALTSHFPPTKVTRAGWPLAALGGAFVGYVGFGRGMGIAEGALAVIAWNAISHLSLTDPRSSSHSASSFSTSSAATGSTTAPAPLLTRLSTFYRHLRATIKTILASPESRRIYFFLCLNLAYMFVQMAYGIWTNSLGLISDCELVLFLCDALAGVKVDD